MEFNQNKCEKCGAYLVLRQSGDIPTRLAPLNWWECPNCGRSDLNHDAVITTSNTNLMTAEALRKLADLVNRRTEPVSCPTLFDSLYDGLLANASKGVYEFEASVKAVDFEPVRLTLARFSEMGLSVSCTGYENDWYVINMNF